MMKRTIASLCLALLLPLVCLTGCGSQEPSPQAEEPSQTAAVPEEPSAPQEEPEEPSPTPEKSRLIVLDPGHQARANTEQEPIGPGASETKMKVTGGTAGVATGVPEYELTLTVSQLLRQDLEARGYQVIMTRESHDVNLSNQERAEIANQSGGDLFLRLHANGSEDSSVQGAMTLCPTPQNPYPIGQLYAQCRLLSDLVLAGLTEATGAQAQMVWETDTMSGINWCQIPVTIVEMGYMSNPQEDALLNDPAYQAKLAAGIANGVDQYFAQTGG